MNWNDGVDGTRPGTSFSIIQNVQTHETMRSSVVVAWVAAHVPLLASQCGRQ